MKIRAVMDVRNGAVMQALCGDRQSYRPLQSVLTQSVCPNEVAESFRAHLDISDFYVADLDALCREPVQLILFSALVDAGFRIWAEIGLRVASDAIQLAGRANLDVVAGSETLSHTRELKSLTEQFGASRVIFSLDLLEGNPWRLSNGWREREALGVLHEAEESGAERFLILEIGRIGTLKGPSHADLASQWKRSRPAREVWLGGGIRNLGDLVMLQGLGLDGVVAASAFHRGNLTKRDLMALDRSGP